MQEVDRLGWAVTVPLQAGEYVLGVRANSEALGDLLRELFATRLIPDAEPPRNVSVYLAPPAESGAQELHRLYVTFSRVVRSRSATRVLDGLWHELDGRDVRLAGNRILTDATILVRDGTAHLGPSSWRRSIVDDERRWARSGLQLVDRRWSELDPQAGTVTVPASGLPRRDELTERLATFGTDDRREPAQPAGTFPLASWTLHSQHLGLAKRLVLAGGSVLDRHRHDGPRLLLDLRAVLAELPAVEPGWVGFNELRERITAL